MVPKNTEVEEKGFKPVLSNAWPSHDAHASQSKECHMYSAAAMQITK